MAVCGLCGRAQALLGRACGRVVLMRRSEARIIFAPFAALATSTAAVYGTTAARVDGVLQAITLVVERMSSLVSLSMQLVAED